MLILPLEKLDLVEEIKAEFNLKLTTLQIIY